MCFSKIGKKLEKVTSVLVIKVIGLNCSTPNPIYFQFGVTLIISRKSPTNLMPVSIFSWPPWGVNSRRGCVRSSVRPFVRTSPLTLFVYNSGSEWDIFLKFFGDIPGIFVDYFWIIPNFLYVCQSVSWLTSLLI